jgi:hypothetical protein
MPAERRASTGLRIVLFCFLTVPGIVIASEKGESITGRVSTRERHLEGVTIALRVAGSATVAAAAVTGHDGKYRLRGVADGAYIVTPEKAGYVFTPRTRSVTIEDDAVKTQDFVAFTAHTISGRVTTNHGGASAP